MFLAYVSPLGRALVDKGLYLPESWTSDKDRCEAAGVPEDRQGYRSKTELALEMVGRAQERGHLKAGWVAADDAFGMSPSFREGLAALGMWYVLDVPSGFTVWPPEPAWTSAEYQGFGRPRKPRLRDGQRRTMEQRSDELPEDAWREITVAEGSQGPRSYLFSAQRVRPTSRRKPGEIHWAVYRRNRDGSEPRYYLSNAPEDTPLTYDCIDVTVRTRTWAFASPRIADTLPCRIRTGLRWLGVAGAPKARPQWLSGQTSRLPPAGGERQVGAAILLLAEVAPRERGSQSGQSTLSSSHIANKSGRRRSGPVPSTGRLGT